MRQSLLNTMLVVFSLVMDCSNVLCATIKWTDARGSTVTLTDVDSSDSNTASYKWCDYRNEAVAMKMARDYDSATCLFKIALERAATELSPADTMVAALWDSLAQIYQLRANHEEAIQALKTALYIRQVKLGENHIIVAQSLDRLAAASMLVDDLSEARRRYEQALVIRQRALGSSHLDIALNLESLAACYSNGEREAAELLKRALAIREQVLGPDNIGVARALVTLGDYYVVNHYSCEDAEPLFEQASVIVERTYGPSDTILAGIINRIACCRRDGGSYEDARCLFEKSLRIRENSFGSNDLRVAESLVGLASLYAMQDSISAAVSLYRKALAIREGKLGPDHVDVASVLEDLAFLTHDCVFEDSLRTRALSIREKAGSPHDRMIAGNINFLVPCIIYLGDLNRAEALLNRASKILWAHNGDWGELQRNFARLHFARGRYDLAEQVLKDAESQLQGLGHPIQEMIRWDLLEVLRKQGKNSEAKEWEKKPLYINVYRTKP